MNKLTLQDFCKYNKAKVKNGKDINEIERIDFYDNMFKTEFGDWIFAKNCKLILRDITQLTDEEKEHIAETYLNDSFDNSHIPKTNGKSVASIQNIQEQITLILEICSFEQIVEFIDYLRSINIDIDGFLESGKAVKEDNNE